MPKLSVITPSCRSAKVLRQLLRDFRNQTLKDFEHLIVYDGEPPAEVADLMKSHKGHPQTTFVSIPKDTGNMMIAPGTRPRNHGVTLATGEWVVFCDDDDRYKDTYCETLAMVAHQNIMPVVQMSCSEYRQSHGDPTRIKLIPEVGLPMFPMICHVGTPCFAVRREWAVAEPWQNEPEHDFRFIKRICERFHPQVRIIAGMLVDVDGLVVKGLNDWVSMPPFIRGDV